MKLIIEKEPMGSGYQVHLDGVPGIWDRGRSVHAALGNFMFTHIDQFKDLEIEVKE